MTLGTNSGPGGEETRRVRERAGQRYRVVDTKDHLPPLQLAKNSFKKKTDEKRKIKSEIAASCNAKKTHSQYSPYYCERRHTVALTSRRPESIVAFVVISISVG